MRVDTWIGCTPDGKPPVVGTRYKCVHERKGEFFGVCTRVDGDAWADLLVTDGVAGAVMSYNVKWEGDTVSVRSSLCMLVPTEGDNKA